jgi:hypothetical protein
LIEDRPRARTEDPEESHLAARSVKGLTEKQGAILALLGLAGRPLTDPEIREIYERDREAEDWPRQTESGLRTRRNELVKAGLIIKAGKKRLETGRMASQWNLPYRAIHEQAFGQAA